MAHNRTGQNIGYGRAYVCITSLPHLLQAPNSFIPASFVHVYRCCVVEDGTPLPVVIRLGFYIHHADQKDKAKRHKIDKKNEKPDAGVEPATLRLDQSPLGEGET
jgi:hypothetical protein